MDEAIDLVVIGGGAAGFFGAIQCAEHSSGLSIAILERANKVLEKVRISGGGRCNVTHACFEPKPLTTHYPRGEKELLGPFHHWDAQHTIDWFSDHGVELKTESDGRMFPVTDRSQTVIDCMRHAAEESGIAIRRGEGVARISPRNEGGFDVITEIGGRIQCRAVLLATGGTRLSQSEGLAETTGHELAPATPSLFTFHIKDPRTDGLQGLSVEEATVRVVDSALTATGPLLITHWGMSGPAILKCSAWGAVELAERNYAFPIEINWLPQTDVAKALQGFRTEFGKRTVGTKSPFPELPKRLWDRFVSASGIQDETWSQLPKTKLIALTEQLTRARFEVVKKSLNKDEFVTCGGIKLRDINMKTMESRVCPELYAAGEILNIDGITGGFNFQNAWTTGHLAGRAIARKLDP